MENNAPGDMISAKPFRLVKFFSFTSLAVIIVTSLVLSLLISNYTKNVLLQRSEAYNLVLAENVSHQIFQQFVLPLALQNRQIAVEDPRQFKQLDKVVRSATHGMNVHSVTIFSKKENQISYSTISDLVGEKGLGQVEYERALNGENVSVLRLNGSLLNFLPGMGDITCQLRTFIPLRKEKPFSPTRDVMGVIEIVQDLTDDLEALIRLQAWIIFTSLTIMGGLFLALRFIVARADRIIEARTEERRKLEVKLNHSQRLASLGKMVASVAHEIKNPLGIIRSTAEILGKRVGKVAPENSHLAEIIVQETTRLDGIVREFLDFARPQQPRLKPLLINDVLARVTDFMAPEFGKRNIEIKRNFDPALPHIQGDFDQLYQACMNILVNAMQAMPNGGTIFITTGLAIDRKKVFLSIADTGTGMSEEMLAQIFLPFVTSKSRGTGLGLAIVKNIVDNHHGVISVVSRQGEGAEFIMEFQL
ncbi:MAG: two-component sensor histidine kinase [Deltaproteobacteria bacterium]|nr:two-component sensor histidine kinase [Deltaproteobacteria bacterium]